MIASVHPSICPDCGAANRCAVARGAPLDQCWCAQSTIRLPLPADATRGCYCAICLQRLATAHDRAKS